MATKKVKAIFERDTKSFHRFNIKNKEDEVTGTIYIARKGGGVPDILEVELVTKASE
jgi:hypothetical protein